MRQVKNILAWPSVQPAERPGLNSTMVTQFLKAACTQFSSFCPFYNWRGQTVHLYTLRLQYLSKPTRLLIPIHDRTESILPLHSCASSSLLSPQSSSPSHIQVNCTHLVLLHLNCLSEQSKIWGAETKPNQT